MVLLAVVVTLSGGCSMFGKKPDPTKSWSPQRLYRAAKEKLDDGDYEVAIGYYEKLDTRYPFGTLAEQAQLDIAYAYYKFDEPASAVAAADRFIKLHPRHPNVDYAYYLKGLAHFNQGKAFLDRLVRLDQSDRDTGAASDAFENFAELTRRFPQSRYAPDARQRMLYLKNTLAAHEVHVAEYYMRRQAYVAAANRTRYVIENYPSTPVVPKALAIQVMAYRLMGLDKLAADSLRVLQLNYPKMPELEKLRKPAAQ